MEPLSQPDFRKMGAEMLFFKGFKQYICNEMPIRLIKLPQEEFLDRDGVFFYLKGKLVVSNDHQDLLSIIASEMDVAEVTKTPDHTYADAKAEKYIQHSSLIQKFFKDQTPYAVLSHTWITPPEGKVESDEKEMSFNDTETIVKENSKIRIVSPRAKGPGFDKFKMFCHVSSEIYGVEFAWMDTICIDKPTEVNESIGSMFKWYSNSSICIVHLASTMSYNNVASDPWFTRGWTLQELLVPRRVAFFAQNWSPMASYDKHDGIRRLKEHKIAKVIHKVTSIAAEELYDFNPGLDRGIPSRMVWIAKRRTTRGEDIAYSVMGIFGVVFPTDYSEGKEKAFLHLLEAIMHKSIKPNTLSIFNYAGQSVSNRIHGTNILPSDPECYLAHHGPLNDFVHYAPLNPLNLGPNGLKVSLVLVFAVLDKSFSESVANGLQDGIPPTFTCLQNSHAKIWADERVVVPLLHNSAVDRAKFASHNCFVFGIWNFKDKKDEITLPDICPAFLLQLQVPTTVSIDLIESTGNLSPASKVDTQNVIVLKKRKDCPTDLVLGKADLDYFNLSYVECRL
ncbi:hypothetical protein HYPSUDRAFT_830080 [Hypholoma sublateritium FD-334 SS-4]|uniref:Heterokaryon incompatibility domain-containing protein n=1 Tax=Hypholoma sublateritium (strain FD-334 SS-4) TaxID=945553 RepID=A0A0D2NUB5_HYPSF|nr:hypothetical protein HYPSUDRAFT_830080 [Hypholoma sublateritium FD-334 SS-4]